MRPWPVDSSAGAVPAVADKDSLSATLPVGISHS